MSDEIKERTVYMLCRVDKTTGDDGKDVYVGSTSPPLCQRFAEHKHDAGTPFRTPSRLKYYGGSKLYKKMREVGVQNWKIVPLLTFACNRETICGFEYQWVKALGANLNTFSPIDENLDRRRNKIKYHKKNKEGKRFYCGVCDLAVMDKFNLDRHFDTLKHFMKWVWDVD